MNRERINIQISEYVFSSDEAEKYLATAHKIIEEGNIPVFDFGETEECRFEVLLVIMTQMLSLYGEAGWGEQWDWKPSEQEPSYGCCESAINDLIEEYSFLTKKKNKKTR